MYSKFIKLNSDSMLLNKIIIIFLQLEIKTTSLATAPKMFTVKVGMGQHHSCLTGPHFAVVAVPILTTRCNNRSVELKALVSKNFLKKKS